MMNYGEFVLNAQIQKNDISCLVTYLSNGKHLILVTCYVNIYPNIVKQGGGVGGGGGATVIISIQIIRTIMCYRIYILA